MSVQEKQEIARLKKVAKEKDAELAEIAKARGSSIEALAELTKQIHELDIDKELQREMTDTCLRLIEQEKYEDRLGMYLTENDFMFFKLLIERHPNLNNREQKIALMIRMSYGTADIARTSGISTRGMESIRYRMHKKMGKKKHESIRTYMMEMSKELA